MWRILRHTLRALATRACTFAPAAVSRVPNGLPRKAALGDLRSKEFMAGSPQQHRSRSKALQDAKHCFMWRILRHTLRALATRACTFAPAAVSRAPGQLRSKNLMAGCQHQDRYRSAPSNITDTSAPETLPVRESARVPEPPSPRPRGASRDCQDSDVCSRTLAAVRRLATTSSATD